MSKEGNYKPRWQRELDRKIAIREAAGEIEPTLRKIADGCDDPRAVAQKAIAALDKARESV